MIVLHLVTDNYPPISGGLESRTKYLSYEFAKLGYKIFVHVLSGSYDYRFYNEQNKDITLRLPYFENAIIDKSIKDSILSNYLVNSEDFRVKFLCLKNQLLKDIDNSTNSRNIIISNFLTRAGYISHNVAEEIDIPHIPMIVGTDFSRGFRNPTERMAIEMVLKNASGVVALNQEFERAAINITKKKNVVTIHNSIPDRLQKHILRKGTKNIVNIVSDGGYSHKKGTQILLLAFRRLCEQGFSVHLTICGEVVMEQSGFWNKQIQLYLSDFPDNFSSLGLVSKNEVVEQIMKADIYCSPTLGEGCSNARITSLCLGIPMVTTRCGEILDIAQNVSHIYSAMPGDYEGYYDILKSCISDFLNDNIQIDFEKIEQWKNHFSHSREMGQWEAILNFVIEKCYNSAIEEEYVKI
jgi:glycosyltransferase involved in cell wall biosynthesis